MNDENSGRVFYVCFYAEPEVESALATYPSAIGKIDYIIHTLKRIPREVVVVSIAPSRKGYFGGYCKRIDSLESHVYLRSHTSPKWLRRKWGILRHHRTILSYLLKNVRRGDSVIVYHSLYNRFWLRLYRLFVPGRLILQIEDVFSELSPETEKYRKAEWAFFQKMQKCLCVNDLICKKLPEVPEKAVAYGSYTLPPNFKKEPRDTIRLVYAGVIEQERKAAFLAGEAMYHLTGNYELHILGFGREADLAALGDLIRRVNKDLGRTAITYHGRLNGEAYWRFLQNCDIALSTHAYTPESAAAADHTFPSKVISYLANGLPVVAQRLAVLESSRIADYCTFYEAPLPKEIAAAVKNIAFYSEQDSRGEIARLDGEFFHNIKALLGISDDERTTCP